MTIKLGQTARDITTGFKGLVTQKINQLNGNVQFVLQPASKKEGEYPEAMQMDAHLLETVDSKLVDKVTEVTDAFDFELGNEVKDLASGFVGIATEKATHMNGCVSFLVVPKIDPKSMFKDAAPGGTWFSSKRLVLKSTGIVAKVRKPVPAASGKVPGGPASRVSRPTARRG